MRKGMFAAITGGGPFRLLKYFIISGFAVIAIVTFYSGVPLPEM
jgi:hypothetical protein